MAFIYDWQRLAGEAAGDDLIMLIDVSDKAMSDEGSNKLMLGKYVVYATDGISVGVTGGGTINLGGQTLNIVSDGSLDLSGQTLDIGGNVSIDGVFSIAGDTINIDGKAFRIVTPGNIDLTGKTLSVNPAGDNLLIDGVPLPQFDPNGTIDLGGSVMTADGAGTLTLDDKPLNFATAIEGTPGADTELAGWDASGDIEGAGLLRGPGAGKLTLSTSATDAELTVLESGTLELGGRSIHLAGDITTVGAIGAVIDGGGTINLGGQSITLETGNITLSGEGNRLTLRAGDTMLEGGGTLKLDGFGIVAAKTGTIAMTTDIPDVPVINGGQLNLSGFNIVAPKGGDLAMLSDIPAIPDSSRHFVCYARSDSGHNYNSWTAKGGMVWRGSFYGSRPATLVVGYNQTGAGTCFARLYDRTHDLLIGVVSASIEGFQILTVPITLPANDANITAGIYTTTSSTYMWITAIQVDMD